MDGGQQAAITDAVNFQIDTGRVYAHQRNALLSGFWQNIILAGEAHIGRTIPDINVVIGIFDQCLIDVGR